MEVNLNEDQKKYLVMIIKSDLEVISRDKHFLPDRIVAEEILEKLAPNNTNA